MSRRLLLLLTLLMATFSAAAVGCGGPCTTLQNAISVEQDTLAALNALCAALTTDDPPLAKECVAAAKAEGTSIAALQVIQAAYCVDGGTAAPGSKADFQKLFKKP